MTHLRALHTPGNGVRSRVFQLPSPHLFLAEAAVPDEHLPPPLSPGAALLLDFDATLAAHSPGPDGVTVPGHLSRLLWEVREHLDGALALVSARRVADIDRMMGSTPFAVAGQHGAELRAHASGLVRFVDADHLRELGQALRERFADDPRILVEDRDDAIGLHYRAVPQRGTQCVSVMNQLAHQYDDLEVVRGSMVVEARPRGSDKGRAVRRLMSVTPFANRKPVFAGDEGVDGEAFHAARELGGYGVQIRWGAGHSQYRCPSLAQFYLWLSTSIHPH